MLLLHTLLLYKCIIHYCKLSVYTVNAFVKVLSILHQFFFSENKTLYYLTCFFLFFHYLVGLKTFHGFQVEAEQSLSG